MNETVKTILKRRSCCQFNKEIISDEDLLTIIRCGIHAPTALNKQNLFFIGIKNQEIINKYKDYLKDDIYYGAKAIILCFERFEYDFTSLNLGAAIENMLIASESLGYQSCWIHGSVKFDTEEGRKFLKELLSLDKEYRVLDSIAIGKSDNKVLKPLARNTKNDKII